MDFPIHYDTNEYGNAQFVLRGHRLNFLHYDICLSLKVVLISANSAYPDEMQLFAKVPVSGFQV